MRTRLLIAFFLLMVLLVGAGNLWATYSQFHSFKTQLAQQQAKQSAEQKAASKALSTKLCLTLGRLAALQPPAGNAQSNPSRAFDQEQHAILVQLGPDLGCKP
jgi:hypothetical protein